MATQQSPNITLYTDAVPYGIKVSIVLEELGIPYKVKEISIEKGEQKNPEFLKINPNGKVPAITDHDFNVFESGAILIYICDNYDHKGKLLPKDPKSRSQVIQWLMLQLSEHGPMQGEANYFNSFSSENVPYAIQRYTNETKRHFKLLDDALEGKEYLVGNKYTLADIAYFSMVKFHQISGIKTLNDYPNLTAWLARIDAKPATKKGIDVPNNSLREMVEKPEKLEELCQKVKAMVKQREDEEKGK
ncbi:19615_t:CDS:2 [Funneliformis geosporum]|uniref:12296_t:CDS:1 n=1 Tax=Funneliformis geosporum TaxID=1117311 RepID=A0A9W4WKG8_9GLOM|nr:12296_t:CDS:2 [Funneliformis geosporum]CAI2178886.1 19615_t:CDS:2 [Funneliformis geosporum]